MSRRFLFLKNEGSIDNLTTGCTVHLVAFDAYKQENWRTVMCNEMKKVGRYEKIRAEERQAKIFLYGCAVVITLVTGIYMFLQNSPAPSIH